MNVNKNEPAAVINERSQGRSSEKQKNIILPTNQNIKLHESKNAWRPSFKVKHIPGESVVLEDLTKKLRGILNKLTPQKFETLVAQVRDELGIDTAEKLEVVVDLIFENAINAPKFIVPFANMCKYLALIRVPQEGSGRMVQFRKLLLTKCQHEFEKDRNDELQREERKHAVETADSDKHEKLQLKFEEHEKKIRMRQLGNIRFIGELFKLGMLIEPIMHEHIKKLLSQGDEESLECLCRLLKTIGKELEEKGNKNPRGSPNPMNQYFGQMQKIVDRRLTSTRIRFMLQDVIDLKKNNWIPRREESNPKTIDQIHREAEREAREAQQIYQNVSYSNKHLPDNRRKLSGRNMNVFEGGWTPTSKSNKGSYSMVGPSKLKLTKPDEVDSIRLGPGGRGLQSWGKGSSGSYRSTINADVKTALTARSATSSGESSCMQSSHLPPSVRKTVSISEEESLIEAIKDLNRNATEHKSQEIKEDRNQLNVILKGPNLTEDVIEKKTKPLIDEFLHNVDFEKLNTNSDINIDEIRAKLKELLSENRENENIFDWIDANVPPSAVSEPVFIRALALEVYKASITESDKKMELDQFTFKKRLPVLTRFIDRNEHLELQALYAVQHLMNDLNQPKDMLELLCRGHRKTFFYINPPPL